MARIRYLFFLILSVTMFVSSCNTGDDTGNDTTKAIEDQLYSIVSSDKQAISIIYPDKPTNAELEAAKSINKKIIELTGVTPVLKTDFKKKDDVYDSNTREILVGRTAYQETNQALKSISLGEYTIRIIGNKVVIATWSDNAMAALANQFTSLLKNSVKNQNGENVLMISYDLDQTGVYNKIVAYLPSYTGGSLDTIANCGDSTYMGVITSTNAEEFNAYLGTLKEKGYSEYSYRTSVDNIFATYKSDSHAITAYYTPAFSTARLIIEPYTNLPDAAAQNQYTEVCTPKMTMIGRRFSTTSTYLGADSGAGLMCFVIRLSDGRFIVIDGGVATDPFADAIMDTMLDQAPDKSKITIAAWIITHSHNDHTGGFLKFAPKHGAKVALEKLILNFPSPEDAEKHSEKTNVVSTFSTVKSYFPNAKVYKAHTGQVFNIADAEIEVLFTHEDYITSKRSLQTTKNYNNSSMIFRVKIAGQKIMFLGDSQIETNNITCKMYGNYLKSDIVQVAHHGGDGGTKEVYTLIDPSVALFTTTDALHPIYITRDYNYHLVYNLHLKENINAADRIRVFDLPYIAK